MGLFDVFTFKRDAGKVFTAENIKKVLDTARETIIQLIKENMPGPEKKKVADLLVESKIKELTAGVKNSVLNWLIGLLIAAVPTVTQTVYDYLKEKVENL